MAATTPATMWKLCYTCLRKQPLLLLLLPPPSSSSSSFFFFFLLLLLLLLLLLSSSSSSSLFFSLLLLPSSSSSSSTAAGWIFHPFLENCNTHTFQKIIDFSLIHVLSSAGSGQVAGGAPGGVRESQTKQFAKSTKKRLRGGSGTQKVLENTAYLQHGFEKSRSLSRSGAGNQIHGAKTWKCCFF